MVQDSRSLSSILGRLVIYPRQDSVTAEEFKRRLVVLCVKSGITGLPRKQRDRQIILKSVVLTMDRTAEYTETEINEILTAWLEEVGGTINLDYVELRRRLVDQEFLGRNPGGFRYWVAISSRQHLAFDPETENLDVLDVVRTGIADIEDRKRQYLQL